MRLECHEIDKKTHTFKRVKFDILMPEERNQGTQSSVGLIFWGTRKSLPLAT